MGSSFSFFFFWVGGGWSRDFFVGFVKSPGNFFGF